MKKIKIILLVTVIIVSLGASFLIGLNTDKDSLLNEEVSLPKPKHSSFVSMMLETGANTNQYELTTANSWPTTGYKFNKKLSKCENGGKVSWDYTNNRVKMEGTSTDKCYIYFDVVSTIDNYCTSGESLADCIKNYGDQGSNISDIYIHNSTLANGAGDGSYRYAGANPNNYVCFGIDAEECPTDNLYRIIGVFGSQVKLIKYDYANNNLLGADGTYNGIRYYSKTTEKSYKGTQSTINRFFWSEAGSTDNTWSASKLNTISLNTNFIENIGTSWSNMIAENDWQVGGNEWNIGGSSPQVAYQSEIINPDSSVEYSAKIGLMYASDYGFAASPSIWATTLYNFNNVVQNNWMYMGVYEWTITRYANTNTAYYVDYNGRVDHIYVTSDMSVRPVFYLKSSIKYDKGEGTISSPIRIKNQTISEYVKSQYTGTQGGNGLYYHTSSLTNGAGDNSYRYAGANPNNFVCFSSTASTCPTDNLYRIIGVFGDNNHGVEGKSLVKLIKYDYANSNLLGTDGDYEGYGSTTATLSQYWYRYYWNNNTVDNVWNDSNLNTINLNTNYLNSFTNKWQNMIKEVTWKLGGNTYENIVSTIPKNTLYNEITNPAYNTTYNAKIGLMYVSDYVFAALESSWSENVSEYNYLVDGVKVNTNWMYMGCYEWTITKMSNGLKMIYMIKDDGKISIYTCGGESINGAAIRPSFYLTSDVTYLSGSGTISDPILIK